MLRLIISILLVFILLPGWAQSDNTYRYKSAQWPVTFSTFDKSPYGCYILYDLLNERLQPDTVQRIRNSIEAFVAEHGKETGGLYILPGKDLFFRDIDWTSLENYVSGGNSALVAVEVLPDSIHHKYFQGEWEIKYDTAILAMSVMDSAVRSIAMQMNYYQNYEPAYHNWYRITQENLSADYYTRILMVSPDEVGIDNNTILMVRYQVGKGYIYFLSAPLLFTNWALKTEEGFEMWNYVFGNIAFDKVYFDEYVRYPYGQLIQSQNTSAPTGFENDGSYIPEGPYISPLHFILSNTALSMAYALLMTGLLLMVLLNSKRRQRAIPVALKKENTSVQFSDTVARLFYTEGNYAHLARQQYKNFIHISRRKYRIDLRNPDEIQIAQFSNRSGISVEEVKWMLAIFAKAQTEKKCNSNDLIIIHQYVEKLTKKPI